MIACVGKNLEIEVICFEGERVGCKGAIDDHPDRY